VSGDVFKTGMLLAAGKSFSDFVSANTPHVFHNMPCIDVDLILVT